MTYDEDDGRSSRICQNEEDMNYYRILETEFTKTSSSSGVATKVTTKPIDIDLKELNEMLSKNLNNSEFSMKINEDFDDNCNDLDVLTLEELKSLR